MGLFDDVKQVGSGIANVATGTARAVKDVGSAVVGAERNVVGTVASGVSRVAADVASAAHNVSTYARGSENHAGDQLQTMNHQGVSHAPNAGPAMQNHINTPPRPYHTDAVNVDGKTQMQTRDTRTGQVIAGSKVGLRSELVTGGDGKTQIQTRDTKTGGVVGGYGYGALK
jgi:hypothetical protein